MFKFLLSEGIASMYPFNNEGQYAWPANMTSLAQIAATPQVQTIFSNSLGTNFTTFVMWVRWRAHILRGRVVWQSNV